MVGSVLMDRMREEGDFSLIDEPVFFTTSQTATICTSALESNEPMSLLPRPPQPISATLMMLLIIMLLGEYDVGALIGVAAANVSMILFGWLMEKYEEPGSPNWLSYIFGCIAGIVPDMLSRPGFYIL